MANEICHLLLILIQYNSINLLLFYYYVMCNDYYYSIINANTMYSTNINDLYK